MDSNSASIKAAEEWCIIDPNPTTASYVKELVGRSAEDPTAMDELASLFPPVGSRISFGTAGLRSTMKPGPLGMNDLVVVQAAQGIVRYCLKQNNSPVDTKPKAVIGYDHRMNPDLNISSLSFAILTALVFEAAGIEPILLDGFAFTPIVPFVLQREKAIVGIMVTASHNPKQDDGYKVYASDGCQIRAPMDAGISSEIMKNLKPWNDYAKILREKEENYPNDPCLGLSVPKTTQKLIDSYFEALKSHGLITRQASLPQEAASIQPPSFAYTAMHGVGSPYATRVFQEFGLPSFMPVPAQKDPDFSFPTVPFPNPEEKGALDIAKSVATENNCDIVLANDPDADRLAVAEKCRISKGWTVFSGDQIGTMLGHWIWNQIGKGCDKVGRQTSDSAAVCCFHCVRVLNLL